MKQILYLVQADVFIPLFWQVSRYLRARGYAPHFATFLPREHLWLKKNEATTEPDDVYAVRHRPVSQAIFGPGEVDDILGFAIQKTGGERLYWEERLLRVASVLERILDSNQFSAILIWNGEDLIGKTLAAMARKRGIKTVFGENGYFPNTLQFDLEGVNVHSSVTKLRFMEIANFMHQKPRIEIGIPADAKLEALKSLAWTDFLRCFLARKTDIHYYRHFPEHRGGSWFKSQWLKLRRALIPTDRLSLPDKFIFIPFQVHDDTQILLNSRYFKSMEEFFEFCHSAIRRSFGEEYAIVVKEHPEDLGRYSYDRLRRRYPDVLWFRKYSIDTLLDRAAYVFVVNSSVGLQAVQRKKPTIVFGESFYTKEEIVFRVDNLADIDRIIGEAKLGISLERQDCIEKFVRFLSERYFVPGGWKKITPAGVAKAGDRILELIQ